MDKKKEVSSGTSFIQRCRYILALVGDGQSLSAFAAAGGQHFSTIGGRHSLAETVLVDSFPR